MYAIRSYYGPPQVKNRLERITCSSTQILLAQLSRCRASNSAQDLLEPAYSRSLDQHAWLFDKAYRVEEIHPSGRRLILSKRERRYQIAFVISTVVILTFAAAILLAHFSSSATDFNEDGIPHNESFWTIFV